MSDMTDRDEGIVNKVKASKLVTIDLESWIETDRISHVDISTWLDMGLILREDAFRERIGGEDWERYRGRYVRIHCGTDAILPTWSWVLVGLRLKGVAEFIHVGSEDEFHHALLTWKIRSHDWTRYRDQFVILKGCSDLRVHESCYALSALYLSDYAKKILYGEACSNVPLHKA